MEYTDNPKAKALLWELSKKLKTAKHKKVYGRLEKENKILVDEIVKEISKDKKISQAYESWLGLKDDILSTYQNQERALADEPEFRNIKNMVLKSALELSEIDEAIKKDSEKENHEKVNAKESWEERTKKFHQIQAQKQFLLLMKHINHMIEEDYDRKKQQIHVDKKLMRKIMEKKEAHGQKM